MKRKLCMFLILILTLSFGMVSAQAATVVDRVVILEQAIGLEAGTDALIDRIAYLETQLGITAAGGTVEDRVAALEAVLGLAPAAEATAAEAAGTAAFKEVTPLTSIGYFLKDDGAVEAKDGSSQYGTDSYGNTFNTLIYATKNDVSIEYLIGGNYKEFTASLFATQKAVQKYFDNSSWKNATISIYGDDVLLYQTTGFDPKTEPMPISVNIEGVKFLKIQLLNTGISFVPSGYLHVVALGDPSVVK